MAGASDDNEENYWPGYVDALTTMTMVLTFVMMVLGVMVFVLSQDATDSKLGAIARALKMETENVGSMSEADIIAALKQLSTERSVEDAKTDRAALVLDGAGRGGGDRDDSGEKRELKSGGQGINTPPSPLAESPFQSPFDGGLVGNKAAGPGGEYLVSDTKGLLGKAYGTGMRVQEGSVALRFVFDRSAIDLPPLGTEAIEAFVAAQGAGPVSVYSTAMPMEGGASESRRRAYFRAMLIRSRLVKAGISARDIEIQVRDQVQSGSQEVVDITRRG